MRVYMTWPLSSCFPWRSLYFILGSLIVVCTGLSWRTALTSVCCFFGILGLCALVCFSRLGLLVSSEVWCLVFLSFSTEVVCHSVFLLACSLFLRLGLAVPWNFVAFLGVSFWTCLWLALFLFLIWLPLASRWFPLSAVVLGVFAGCTACRRSFSPFRVPFFCNYWCGRSHRADLASIAAHCHLQPAPWVDRAAYWALLLNYLSFHAVGSEIFCTKRVLPWVSVLHLLFPVLLRVFYKNFFLAHC